MPNEFLQRKLVSPDKQERNRRTLIAVAAGLVAANTLVSTLPARSRVSQMALALRLADRKTDSPFPEPIGARKSPKGNTLLRLRRDIAQPNNDRDYRSMCIFLFPLLLQTALDVRIFDFLHSGSGDAVLHVNILGRLEVGQKNGFLDLLASGCHMGRLQSGNGTSPPRDRSKRLGSLADFAAVHPWVEASVMLDSDK